MILLTLALSLACRKYMIYQTGSFIRRYILAHVFKLTACTDLPAKLLILSMLAMVLILHDVPAKELNLR